MIDAVKLITYNTWANQKIAGQIQLYSHDQLTKETGGSFPSIRLTLLHLIESDWIWMHRFKGMPLVAIPTDWPTNDVPAMVAIWMSIQQEMEAVVANLVPTRDATIAFTTKKGVSYSMPFLDIVIHVTNHGTYHRGQMVNMIRMLGEQPVNTDYFIFCTLPDKEAL